MLFGYVAVLGPVASVDVFADLVASAYVFPILLVSGSFATIRPVSVKFRKISRRSSSFVCS